MLSNLACKLKIHRWQYDIHGHYYEGFMYPIRYRTCKFCGGRQVEVIDKISNEVIWQQINSSQM